MNLSDARRSGWRPLGWLALLVLAVAVAAIVAYSQRHSVAKRIANTLLRDYGFETARLSVGELSHDRILLDELVVVSDGGDRYVLHGVTLPSIAGRGAAYSAERLHMTRGEVDRPAAPFGELLDVVLGLPETLANTEIRIGELRAFGDLVLRDLAWSTVGAAQALSFRFENLAFDVDLRPSGAAAVLLVRAAHPASAALSAELELGRVDGIYRASGPVTIDASPWMRLLQSFGVLPRELALADAVLAGSLTVAFDEEAPGSLTTRAELELAGDASLMLDASTQFAIHAPLATKLAYRYPADEWQARIDTLNLGTTIGGGEVPIVLENVDCLLGVRCRSGVRVSAEGLRFGENVAASVDLRFDGTVAFGEALRLTIDDDASATIAGLDGPAFRAESLTLTSLRAAGAAIGDDDWRWDVGELGLAVQRLEAAPGLVLSFPVTLSDAGFDGAAGKLSSSVLVPPGVAGTWDDRTLMLPGIRGAVELAADFRSAKLVLAGDGGGMQGAIDWREDVPDGSGKVAVRALVADFSRTPLSDYVPGLEDAIDIVRGTWAVDADLAYDAGDPETVLRATATHRIDGLAGRLGETVFAGLSGHAETGFDSGTGNASAAGDLAADLLEVGLPIENLRAGFAADGAQETVRLESLAAEALGGRLTVPPFTWHATGEPQTAMLHIESVQLGLIVELLDFEDIAMDGAVSGTLPVRIEGTNMTIADGKLESDAPGGVIRYGAGSAAPGSAESDLAFVTNALRNFEFESLSSVVDYGDAGDLVLKMRLAGISPDVDPLQPVILNLSVENNIPQMLRSLQAVRSIQDILEQKTLH